MHWRNTIAPVFAAAAAPRKVDRGPRVISVQEMKTGSRAPTRGNDICMEQRGVPPDLEDRKCAMEILKPFRHLGWYREVARLFVTYGRPDIARFMGWARENGAEGRSNPEDLPRDLERLGPTFIKLGQFLSTRADMLPPEYLEPLSRLQDQAASVPYREIRETLAGELGMNPDHLFRRFDRKPLASASLAQVHYAELLDGRQVAVKVQRPDIRRRITSDLEALGEAARLLDEHSAFGRRYLLLPTYEEFRRAMIRELDFGEEARSLRRLGRNLDGNPSVVVPRPVEGLVTSRVLVMEYIRGVNIARVPSEKWTALDGRRLSENLFRAYLKQILVDGFYHADPHPGNILLTDDGRVALLDLGMAGSVPAHLRIGLVKLLIAMAEGNGKKAASTALELGRLEEDADEESFCEAVEAFVSRCQQQSRIEKMKLGAMIMETAKISSESGIRPPDECIMLGKTLLNLDRVGRTMNPDFDPYDSIRRNAGMLLRAGSKGLSAGNLVEAWLDTKSILTNLPGRMDRILESLSRNRFRIRAHTFDESYVVGGLKEVANRLTLGIILAALIVGAALMMRVETSFRILEYPGIAILFFLLTGFGGFALVLRILFDGRRN